MEKREIKYEVYGVRFNDIHENTYHSVRVNKVPTGETLVSDKKVYGYDDHYRQTARELMFSAGWIPQEYKGKLYYYDSENNYPIEYHVYDGRQKDMYANVQ